MKKELSEKKKLIRLIAFWGVCLLVGFGIGWGISVVTKIDNWDPAAVLAAAAPGLSVLLGVVFVLLNAGVLGWGWWTARRCAAQAAVLTADDEDAMDALEGRLSTPMIATSLLMVVDMMLYAVIVYLVLQPAVTKAASNVLFAITCVTFFAGLFGGFAINKRCVDAEKQLNPEKRGSMLDLSFQKTWLASCDEAQQQVIYKAGYQAFRAGNTACMALWMVSVLLMFLLDTGVVPVIMVCAVWLTMQISYFAAANRLERGNG